MTQADPGACNTELMAKAVREQDAGRLFGGGVLIGLLLSFAEAMRAD